MVGKRRMILSVVGGTWLRFLLWWKYWRIYTKVTPLEVSYFMPTSRLSLIWRISSIRLYVANGLIFTIAVVFADGLFVQLHFILSTLWSYSWLFATFKSFVWCQYKLIWLISNSLENTNRRKLMSFFKWTLLFCKKWYNCKGRKLYWDL